MLSSIMLFFSSLLHVKDKGIVGQLIHRSEQSACMYMAGTVIVTVGFLVTPHDGMCLLFPVPTTYINHLQYHLPMKPTRDYKERKNIIIIIIHKYTIGNTNSLKAIAIKIN